MNRKPWTVNREPSEERPILLLVEDNLDMRTYIKSALETDYQVIEAVDGESGVAKAREVIPDLVISDLMMPKMDGYEVCKTLKTDERTSHIPVILLTARAAREDKLEGLETGADDYLTKPFDAEELLTRIKNLIQLRQKLRTRYKKESGLKPADVAVTSLDQQFLEKMMAIIEANMADEHFDVETLCRKIALSQSQLRRKLKALINQSPKLFIRSLRLQRARQLLSQNAGSVSEIAYQTGFSSPAYFSKCFREEFGQPPSMVDAF